MTNILITGSDGQLGSEISAIAAMQPWASFDFTTINDLDITNADAVANKLASKNYHLLVNCSAYTAVDKAETEQEPAFKVNTEAVGILADACRKTNTRIIHVSTDYVFDGQSFIPYKEDDHTNPQSVYGQTKLEGEKRLVSTQPDSVIIRTAWLYSSFGNNFVKTMLKYGKERDKLRVVFDQIGTPTYAYDLAECIMHIAKLSATENVFHSGVYHFTNEGVASWYDFAVEIIGMGGIKCIVEPLETSEYPTAAKRPPYSVLNKKKIKELYGISIPHWKESLKKCIDQIEKQNIQR